MRNRRSLLLLAGVASISVLLGGILLATAQPSAHSSEHIGYRDGGVIDPENPEGEGPDATATPTRTPTRTATPSPTPTPPCYVVQVEQTGVHDDRTDLRINSSGAAKQASCIHNLVSKSINYWTPSAKTGYFNTYNHANFVDTGYFRGLYTNNSRKWSDDGVISGLWNNLLINSGRQSPVNLPSGAARNALYWSNRNTFISCTKWASYGDDALQGRKLGGGDASLGEKACWRGMVFLDAACRMIALAALDTAQRAACLANKLFVQYLGSTPISLIFEGDEDPMRSFKIVKFPLDPSTDAKYWEWRGSKAAPLLVYDPQHRGEITAAEQVFGVWALGGKPNSGDPKAARSKWSHGFEALASLDANVDEQISGDELSPLGLWFDENEDAISQAGEVRSARDVGIEALFFKVDKTDDPLGDLTVSIGYQRKIDGKLTTGKAVDWRARGHTSAEGLMIGRVLGGDGAAPASNPLDAQANAAPSESDLDERTALQSIYSPAGIWQVILEPDSHPDIKDKVGETMLAFNVSSPNFLEGYALSEVGIAGMQNAARALAFSYTSGHKNLNVDGTIALGFTTESEFARLENTATMDKDGNTMHGKTVAHLADDKKLKYSWRAVKIFNPSDISTLEQ